MLDRVLVANRGEIAARIIRTARQEGVETVAVHAADDAAQPHVRLADHAVSLGGGPPAETYLDAEAIVEAALETGCTAVHPGYGFLSEDASFARRVHKAGLTWIGPPPSAIELLGDKAKALALADELGVPTTPGSDGPVQTPQAARDAVEAVGLPAVVKAVHGGGGMGMVKVTEPGEVEEAFHAAREQAKAAFGSPDVLVERWWEAPRHVEVQVAFDAHGEGVHLFERECSLQRRNQKLVEEAPAPNLDATIAEGLREDALRLAQAAGVENLATVEFLVTEDGYVFNEVNPRLQVEHTVTEQITGEDLVAWQLAIADGRPLPRSQAQIRPDGWAIEARVNVEDPLDGFQPAPGPIDHVHVPQGTALRVDHALVPGGSVSSRYDSLVAKVITHGPDREAAIDACRKGLAQLRVGGRPTTAGFLHQLLDTPPVRAGEMSTTLVDGDVQAAYRERIHGAMAALVEATPVGTDGAVELDGHRASWRRTGERIEIDGQLVTPIGEVEPHGRIRLDGRVLEGRVRPEIATRAGATAEGERLVESPLAGTVDQVLVEEGDPVEEGTELLVVEAMKMKNRIGAKGPGTVAEVLVEPGETVVKGDGLIRVEAD